MFFCGRCFCSHATSIPSLLSKPSGMTFLKHPLSSICSWNHALPGQHPFQISLEYQLLFLWCIFPVSLEDGGSLTGVELGDGVFNIEKHSPWLVGHPVDGRLELYSSSLCNFVSVQIYSCLLYLCCVQELILKFTEIVLVLSFYGFVLQGDRHHVLYIDRTGCRGLNRLRINRSKHRYQSNCRTLGISQVKHMLIIYI